MALISTSAVILLIIAIGLSIYTTRPPAPQIPRNCPNCGDHLDLKESMAIVFAPPILLEKGEIKQEVEFCLKCLSPETRLNQGNMKNNLRLFFSYDEKQIEEVISAFNDYRRKALKPVHSFQK
ncbi:MAG: hypothetical protein WC603_02365 [Candidatus Paceibacterota bacterium]